MIHYANARTEPEAAWLEVHDRITKAVIPRVVEANAHEGWYVVLGEGRDLVRLEGDIEIVMLPGAPEAVREKYGS